MIISTPCTKVCTMDARSGLCIGCGRTLDEVARWGAMEESERTAIMKTLPARLGAIARAASRRVES